MANKFMKKYSATLAFREMQIKAPVIYYLTPIRMAVIKKREENKCFQGYGEV